jgi:hypothetical protein
MTSSAYHVVILGQRMSGRSYVGLTIWSRALYAPMRTGGLDAQPPRTRLLLTPKTCCILSDVGGQSSL